MYCRNYRLWISWLVHSLKSTVWEHGLAFNMWKRPKYLQNFHETVFIMFFIILREVDLENVSHSVRWNLRVFVYILTADVKYSLQGFENLELRIQMQLFLKQKHFLNFLKEKMIFIANVFAILQMEKFLLENCFKGMWKRPNCLQNLHESAFIMFLYHSQACWFGICLP